MSATHTIAGRVLGVDRDSPAPMSDGTPSFTLVQTAARVVLTTALIASMASGFGALLRFTIQ